MLHAILRGRQVRALLHAAIAAAALAPAVPAVADQGSEVARAEALSRAGQHDAAATIYEQQARRLLRSWDTRLALLAAREYLEAGRPADAERVLGRVEDARGDDAVLEARLRAELALSRGNGPAALAALSRIPRPWPAPLAPDLLLLEARADFLAGRTLEGIRAMDERGLELGAADARAANDRLLLELLRTVPGGASVPAGASESERGWIELAAMDTSQADAVAARRAADWRARYPNHRGAALLSATTSFGAGPSVAPGATAGRVALLLPLSGKQQAAGLAVRDGYVAAALARGDADVRTYDTASAGPVAAYRQAIADGAGLVVGPLTREDVAALVAGQSLPVPTLALNGWSGPGAPPAFLYQYSLDPEQEARAAARRLAADGLSRGVALFPRGAWGDRVEAAFTEELASTGVALLATARYEPGSRDFSGPLRQALGRYGGAGERGAAAKRDAAAESREGPQFVYLAASAATARALVPQLRFQMTYAVPVYATSDAWDPGVRSVPDLDGLVYPEFPWVLRGGQGAPELWELLGRQWSTRARGRVRLYAFGHDAATLAADIASGRAAWTVDGLTGGLALGGEGRVTRTLEWARIVGGRPQPAGAPVPTLPGAD